MTYTITCESRLHQRLANCGRYSGIPLLEHLTLASFSETFPARGMVLLEVTAGAHHSPPPLPALDRHEGAIDPRVHMEPLRAADGRRQPGLDIGGYSCMWFRSW
jgi:hypothetical protein